MEPELDPEISSIRAEIRNLQSRKRFLSSSLLASDSLQNHLTASSSSSSPSQSLVTEEASPLLQSANTHAESNHHRIAFSTTTFPFKDPSPHNTNANGNNNNLLGVRIDICARNGHFAKPYYVLLKRVPGVRGKNDKQQGRRLRVHRHTIPAFISMDRLERVYLPTPPSDADVDGHEEAEDEELNLKPWKKKQRKTNNKKQDLHTFVRTLRRELVAWQLRRDAIGFLREKLGVQSEDYDGHDDPISEERDGWLPINSVGLVSLAPTALEARYIRLEWEDGRVGRFKMANNGAVERAVVIGDQGRDKGLEGAITGGDGRVETVLDRLMEHSTETS